MEKQEKQVSTSSFSALAHGLGLGKNSGHKKKGLHSSLTELTLFEIINGEPHA